ncbi:MAG: sulfotransferase domain-containing protein [Limnoraphis sp.]
MPTHCYTQAVLNHYQKALTFSPQPAKIQERIAGRPWMLWDIPQAMEHYLQAQALNPQAQWHHWRLYFGLQCLVGLESPRLLEFCDRIIDLLEPNTPHYSNRGVTGLLFATAYRYLGKPDRARNFLHQSYRAILAPHYPELIETAWTERRQHPPNFLIIGVWKCGTTSLYHYLSQHPQILPALAKELHYFTGETHWQQSPTHTDYLDYFPPIDHPHYQTGEATPGYIIQPHLVKSLRHWFPDLKIIILLRNPVKRTISDFYMRQSTSDPTFAQTLDGVTHIDLAKVDAIADQLYTDLKTGVSWLQCFFKQQAIYQTDISLNLARHLAFSQYIRYLPQWFEQFPREQILVIRSEDLFQKTPATLQEIYNFLGLEHHPLPEYRNVNQRNYNTISPQLHQQLTEYFRPYNQQLEDYL